MNKVLSHIDTALSELAFWDSRRRYIDPKTSKEKEIEKALEYMGVCDENGLFNLDLDPEVDELIKKHFPA